MTGKYLCGLGPEEILSIIEPWDYKLSHAVSISSSIYRKRIAEFSEFREIPHKLIALLSRDYNLGIFTPVRLTLSADRTEKYLFKTWDGRMFETVFIPDGKRNTVCVSVQSGCRMGCSFCATAAYGFFGNLTAGEIVGQVLSVNATRKVTHVVMMGMGEPMDNLDNVMKACNILTSEWGLALSPGNITVSSVGIMTGIADFLSYSRCNLAISLLSPFPGERKSMVPAESKNPVGEILDFLRGYPLKGKRRISIAYVMIRGTNDTDGHLSALMSLVKGSGIRVNLLAYHPVHDDHKESSAAERMLYFKHRMVTEGISASIRKSRGSDISAACGLLASDLVSQV